MFGNRQFRSWQVPSNISLERTREDLVQRTYSSARGSQLNPYVRNARA